MGKVTRQDLDHPAQRLVVQMERLSYEALVAYGMDKRLFKKECSVRPHHRKFILR
jgi:hypothetical protein